MQYSVLERLRDFELTGFESMRHQVHNGQRGYGLSAGRQRLVVVAYAPIFGFEYLRSVRRT